MYYKSYFKVIRKVLDAKKDLIKRILLIFEKNIGSNLSGLI